MLKVALVMLLAVAATGFAMDNMHRVELGLVVGRPVHVRLFFLLLTCFLVGCLITFIMDLYVNARARREATPSREDEAEDFFSE